MSFTENDSHIAQWTRLKIIMWWLSQYEPFNGNEASFCRVSVWGFHWKGDISEQVEINFCKCLIACTESG